HADKQPNLAEGKALGPQPVIVFKFYVCRTHACQFTNTTLISSLWASRHTCQVLDATIFAGCEVEPRCAVGIDCNFIIGAKPPLPLADALPRSPQLARQLQYQNERLLLVILWWRRLGIARLWLRVVRITATTTVLRVGVGGLGLVVLCCFAL